MEIFLWEEHNEKHRSEAVKLTDANGSAADVQGKPCKLESSVQTNRLMAALRCQKVSLVMKMEYI